MINFQVLVLILLVHFLADFALQTHEQATNKWHSFDALGWHVVTYGFCIFILGVDIFPTVATAFWFYILNSALHWITDFVTSKFTHKFFEEKDFHNGFVVVGADQLIHVITLVGTFLLLK